MSRAERRGGLYLPAAEILEEEVKGSSPHYGSGHDAEQRNGQKLLRAAKLKRSRGTGSQNSPARHYHKTCPEGQTRHMFSTEGTM